MEFLIKRGKLILIIAIIIVCAIIVIQKKEVAQEKINNSNNKELIIIKEERTFFFKRQLLTLSNGQQIKILYNNKYAPFNKGDKLVLVEGGVVKKNNDLLNLKMDSFYKEYKPFF